MLFTSFKAASLQLSNRAVMSPLTRSRASQDNIPSALMAEYYGQRATAGLIITEGTSPSPNGLGYPRIPGLFNDAQVAGLKRVTDAVHSKGGKDCCSTGAHRAGDARCQPSGGRRGTRPLFGPMPRRDVHGLLRFAATPRQGQ